MEHKAEKGLQAREIFFVITVSLVFIALIWRMVPIHNLWKCVIVCLAGAWIFAIVVYFFVRLPYFIPKANNDLLITITCVVFLLFPSLINITHETNKQQYLSSITPDTIIGLKIDIDVERTGGSGSIGSEWKYKHYFNDIQFTSKQIMEVKASDPFTIRSRFMELDDKVNDIGETTSKQFKFYKDSQNNDEITIINNVFVMENGGKRYAGSSAEFDASYHVVLTTPPSMTFWDVYFNTQDNSTQKLLVIGLLCCFGIIAYVILDGEQRESKLKEQEKLASEQKKKEARDTFINSLGGRTIREVAGVPVNIIYENGLPKDNNNQRFGSYTAYITKSGSCYHRLPGCCSARYPIHGFTAMKNYRPCSKCGASKFSIPSWHTSYIELVSKCNEYSVEHD